MLAQALALVVVARENPCRRGADTAAGATRAKSAASAGESAPSWSGSWKRSSSVVGWCRVRAIVAVGCGASARCWLAEDGVRRYRKTTSRSGGTRKCACVAASTVSGTSRAAGFAGSGYHGFVWTLRLVKVIVVISAGRKRKLLLTTSRSLSACNCAISGGMNSRLLFPTPMDISKPSKL